MVIRCSNCNSAYAVNDSKVENKKFAFNCPNCSAENIIDNRGSAANAVATGGDLSGDQGKDNLSPDMGFQGQEESAVLTDDSASTDVSEEADIMGESEIEFDEGMADGLSGESQSTIIDEPIEEPVESSIEEPGDELVMDDEILTEETMDEGLPDSMDDDLSLDDIESGTSSDDELLDDIPDLQQKTPEEEFIAHEESLDLSDAEDLDFSFDDEVPAPDEGVAEDAIAGVEEDLDLDFDIDDVPDISNDDEDLDLDLTFDEDVELDAPQIVQDELDVMEDEGISEGLDDLPEMDDMSADLENEIIDESEELAELDDLHDIDLVSDDLSDEVNEDIDIIGDLDDLPDIDTMTEDLDDLPDSDTLPEGLIEIEEDSDEMKELEKESKIDTILDDMPLGIMHDSESPVSDFEPVEEDTVALDSGIGEGEDSVPGIDEFAHAEPVEEDDDSITIDLDSLDIELEEGDDTEDVQQKEFLEEDIVIDLPKNVEEELDIDISDNVEEELEIDIPESAHEMEVASSTEASFSEEPAGSDEDEDTTLDLDSLDIDIEGDDLVLYEEPEGGDEDTTLDLDSLDIDIDEDEVVLSEGETPGDIVLEESSEEPSLDEASVHEDVDEDEDTTLDLDSLDIPVAESDDVFSGEIMDEEDEKLTLEDAGLTMEELTSEEAIVSSSFHEDSDEDEDIKLTIDEIDPNLNLDNIEDELGGSVTSGSEPSIDEVLEDDILGDDLIDLDYNEELGAAEGTHVDDKLIELEESELTGRQEKVKSRKEMIKNVARGTVNFSIDYSLKYSRTRALLRLFLIYFIALIPHFIVYSIYNILSVILGFINQIIVFTTGNNIEDFSEIQENTIRYLLSIFATSSGIIDELPVFAGREDIDYPLQLDLTYPLRYSKVIAAIRLSVVGILIINIPHWIILGLLTLSMPVIALIGLLSVIITGRWPHFLFDILTRYYRYFAKILAFTFGLVDSYPPFDFK